MSHPNSSATAASSVLIEAAQQTYPESALYVLATPIGNVCDVTLRALHVLAIADAVACEDTRNTSHLLSRYGISQTLIAAHEHNEHGGKTHRLCPAALQAAPRTRKRQGAA